jgi:hypothetical protein
MICRCLLARQQKRPPTLRGDGFQTHYRDAAGFEAESRRLIVYVEVERESTTTRNRWASQHEREGHRKRETERKGKREGKWQG